MIEGRLDDDALDETQYVVLNAGPGFIIDPELVRILSAPDSFIVMVKEREVRRIGLGASWNRHVSIKNSRTPGQWYFLLDESAWEAGNPVVR